MEVLVALCLFLVITLLVYARIGFSKIVSSYGMWFEPGYWVNYNIVEALAWVAKAAVILPGLIWQKEIWQLHIITLVTSALLIWVSERKLLPTLGGWPTAGTYGRMRLAIRSNDGSPRTITFEAANAGTLRVNSTNWTSALSGGDFIVTSATSPKIVDVWTVDGGITVFMEYAGEYTILS